MKCNKLGEYRFTWPGSNESFICCDHVGQLKAVANAIGLSLQIIPIENDIEKTCQQEVKE